MRAAIPGRIRRRAKHGGGGVRLGGVSGSEGPGAAGFEAWYAREFPRVRATLALAVGDAGLAEEATAEAFARALVGWATVSRAHSPAAWVYTVALNQVRSTLRRLRLERRWLQRQRTEPIAPPAEPDDELWAAVAGLPQRARTAVALRYVADLSEAEVAAAMGVARGTVAATLHQARRRLAAELSVRAPGRIEATQCPGGSAES
jgi:RNA polymerase sigma factor (sigma-70 family)